MDFRNSHELRRCFRSFGVQGLHIAAPSRLRDPVCYGGSEIWQKLLRWQGSSCRSFAQLGQPRMSQDSRLAVAFLAIWSLHRSC